MAEALALHQVSKGYRVGGHRVVVLRGVELEVAAGELVLLLGRSGSGKTTLLSLAGALDRPDSGQVAIDGVDVTAFGEDERARFRRRAIGWVFQSSGLLPMLSALENVALAPRMLGAPRPAADEAARAALRLVGIEDRAQHRAHELSGGEQQRVALARALVKDPRLLLADEPTGQLDTETGAHVGMLLQQSARAGAAVLVATHDTSLAERADRVVTIEDGLVRLAA